MPQNSLKLHTPFLKGGAPRQLKKGGPEAAASFASPNIHYWLHALRTPLYNNLTSEHFRCHR